MKAVGGAFALVAAAAAPVAALETAPSVTITPYSGTGGGAVGITASRSDLGFVTSNDWVTFKVVFSRPVMVPYFSAASFLSTDVTLANILTPRFTLTGTTAGHLAAAADITYQQISPTEWDVVVKTNANLDVAQLAIPAGSMTASDMVATALSTASAAASKVTRLKPAAGTDGTDANDSAIIGVNVTGQPYTGFVGRPVMLGGFSPNVVYEHQLSIVGTSPSAASPTGTTATELITVTNGFWFYTPTVLGMHGMHSYVATAQDVAGNKNLSFNTTTAVAGANTMSRNATGSYYSWDAPSIDTVTKVTAAVTFVNAMSVSDRTPVFVGTVGLPLDLDASGVGGPKASISIAMFDTGTSNPAINFTPQTIVPTANANPQFDASWTAGTYTNTGLADGTYDVVITQRVIGSKISPNSITTTKTFTVSAVTVPTPTLAVTTPNPDKTPDFTVTRHASDTATLDLASIKMYRTSTSGDYSGGAATPVVGTYVAGTASTGTWTYADASALVNGTYYFKWTHTDAAGNVSAASNEVTLVIQTEKPTLVKPTTAVVATVDTTYDHRPVFTINKAGLVMTTTPKNIYVYGLHDAYYDTPSVGVVGLGDDAYAEVLGTKLSDPSGTSITWKPDSFLVNSDWSFKCQWKDAGNNLSDFSDVISFRIATDVPTLAMQVVAAVSYDHTPSFLVTCAGTPLNTASITMYKKLVGTDADFTNTIAGTENAGVWTATNPLPNGAYLFKCTWTDANGNVSLASSPDVSFTIGTETPILALKAATAPDAPLTPNFRQVITITGITGLPAVGSIKMYDNASGSETAGTLTGSDWKPDAQFALGAHSLRATWTNETKTSPLTVTPLVFNVAVPVPVLAARTPASGTVAALDGNHQYRTADMKPTFAVTGVTAGATHGTLKVYRKTRGTAAGFPGAIIDRTTADGLGDLVTVVPGTFAAGVWTPQDAFVYGAWSLCATWVDTDTAHDTDDLVAVNDPQTSVASNVLNIRVLPLVDVPVITGVFIKDGTGTNALSGTTAVINYLEVMVKGTANAGATIKLYRAGILLPTVVADGHGDWQYVFAATGGNSTAFTGGTNALTAKQLDLCGVESALTPKAVSVIIDSHTPTPPLIKLPLTGAVMALNTPTFSGTSEANAVIRLYKASDDSIVCAAGGVQASTTGIWSIPTTALAVGSYSIYAKATSAAGITSVASTAVAITIQAPTLDVALEPLAAGTGYTTNLYKVTTAAHALGATTINLNTGSGTILVGDEVSFAGDNIMPANTVPNKYTVTVGSASPATRITITPPLKKAIALNAAPLMTITGPLNTKARASAGSGNTTACSLPSIFLTATMSAGTYPASVMAAEFTMSDIVITGGKGTVTSLTKGTGLPGQQATNVWTIGITPATIQTTGAADDLEVSIPAGAFKTTPAKKVSAITPINGGSNYMVAPAVVVSASPTGVTATGTATLTNGVVTSISVDNAAANWGYTTTPSVTLVTPPGSGARATAVAGTAGGNGVGALNGITVNAGGTLYSAAPKVILTGGGYTTPATATATMVGGIVTAVTLDVGHLGAGYTSLPTVTFSTGSGATASATLTDIPVVFNSASTSYMDATHTTPTYTLNINRIRPTVAWQGVAVAVLAANANMLAPAAAEAAAITGSKAYVNVGSPTRIGVRAHFSAPMNRALISSDLTLAGCTLVSVTPKAGTNFQDQDIVLDRLASNLIMSVTIKAMPDLTDTASPAQLNMASPTFIGTVIPAATAPVIASAVGATAPAKAAKTPNYPCTITFGAPVTGFTTKHLVVTNGVVTKLTGTGNLYSFTLTPGEGLCTVQYDSTKLAVYDVANNAIPTSNLFTRTLDSSQPTVASVSSPMFVPSSKGKNGAITVALVGDAVDTVTGVGHNVITNGGTDYTVAPYISFTGGGTPTRSATATATVAGGIITAITITDGGAGYTSAPTVVIKSALKPADGSRRFPIRMTFNEALPAFPAASLVASVTNGTVAGAVTTVTIGTPVLIGGGGTIYQMDLTVAGGNDTDGPHTVQIVVPSQAVSDAATNIGAASQVYTFVYDLTNGTPIETVISPVFTNG